MRVHPRLSATCLGLALTLGSLWWSAASTYVVLHDDARLVGALARTLDEPAVRGQLAAWTGAALDRAARLRGEAPPTTTSRRAVGQLQRAIASDAPLEPLVTAVTGVVVDTRNAAVSQLDARALPKTEVRADMAPLLAVAGVTVDKKTAAAMGLRLEKGRRVSVPVLSGSQLDLFQHRYDWMLLIRRWAGWVALALLAVSVTTSRRPLRALAVAGGLVAVIALALPRLLTYAQEWAARTELGGLISPILAAAAARVGVVSVPVAVVGGLLALVLGVLQVLLLRRRDRSRRSIEAES